MFFNPLWLYIKQISVTLIVEVGMFAIFISRKPIRIASAISFNVLTHISLHLFFSYMMIAGFNYGFWIWFVGEIFVLIIEATLYWVSKSIPKYVKAIFWSFVFNISSIIVGKIINLIIFNLI